MFRILLLTGGLVFCTSAGIAQNLEQIGFLSYGSVSLAGCWHHVDQSGGEWALVGTRNGLSIVDLADPTQPIERFTIPSLDNNWREVKTWAGYAYFGSEASGSGITIVNLNYLPDSIQWKVWRGDGFFEDRVIESHTVQAEAGYLYICGGSDITNGVVIADLADPWNPHIISKYAANYVHDAFIRGDTLWTSEIFEGQFGVVDISNRTNPVLLATNPTPGAFNHNSGLSADSKILFTTDEMPGAPLGSFDVSDLEDIQLLDTYLPSINPVGEVHNVRVVEGDFLICPSYKGQLSIVDASEPDNLIEVAIVSLGTSLVWDADPYLPSGIVFATYKAGGFYVFKPTYVAAARLQGTVTDALTGFPLAHANVSVLNTPNLDGTGAGGIYKTGAANSGTYTVRAERIGYLSKEITNVILESGTIATLDIELWPQASSADEALSADQMVRVSPTLFEEVLDVEFLAGNRFLPQSTSILLRDLYGRILLEQDVAPEMTARITVPDQLPQGIYVLEVLDAKGLRVATKVAKK